MVSHIFMQQALLEQLTNQITHAARRMEVVNVSLAIGINARHQAAQWQKALPDLST